MNSIKNLIETASNPILVRGGPSSSDVLNNINRNIQQDIVNLNSQIQELDRKYRMLSVYLEQQAVGIQGLVDSLQTQIPAAPSNRGLADFFSSDFIDVDNTAYIDEDYGQATLPITSVQEKMHTIDSQGNIWIPDDSRLRFVSQSSYTAGVIPDDDVFFSSVEDFSGIGSQPDSFFIGGYLTSTSYLYVKAILPQVLNTNRLANRITFHPIPAFSHSLIGAYYRSTDGSWNSIPIDYLVSYTTTTTPAQASHIGPTRLHFTPTEITQVCLVFKASGWWGIQQMGVQFVEYSSTANLVVDLASYNPGNITTTILNGKDTSILNRYPITINGSKVTIGLSQTIAYSSPIISSIDCRW